MGNVLHVLKRDIKRLIKAPAALVVVVALMVLPSLYTWYNVVAFWDPYGHTGNLRVCVVNQDVGADFPVASDGGESGETQERLNVGDRITEALAENDQLDWVEEDLDPAMEDLNRGALYAVYVIPEDFTECLISPLSGEVKRPTLRYYANEKLGPVSPKITDAAATTLDHTVNSMFASTVSDVAVTALGKAYDEVKARVDEGEFKVVARMDEARASVVEAREALASVQGAIANARAKGGDAYAVLDDANAAIADASTMASDLSTEVNAVQTGLSDASSKAIAALSNVPSKMLQTTLKVSAVANGFAKASGKASAGLSLAAAELQPVAQAMQQLSETLQGVADAVPGDGKLHEKLAQQAQDLAERGAQLQADLEKAQAVSERIDEVAQTALDTTDALGNTSEQLSGSLERYSGLLYDDTAPAMSDALGQVGATSDRLSAAIAGLGTSVEQARQGVDQVDALLLDCSNDIARTDGLVADLQQKLENATADVQVLSQSNTVTELLGSLNLDPASISEFIGAPTKLETNQLYHPNAYGAAMAPLFMNLTFWIGAFMLVIIMRLEVDSEGIEKLTLGQRYLARLLLFMGIAVVQAVVCCAGVLYLGVQVVNIPALFGAAAVSSLAYLSVIYCLSVTLRHIGKGVCLVLVFAQIPGGSGLYPMELTSRFFQALNPFLPFSYGIDAMREAICGFYGNHFSHDLVMLGVFFFGALLVGLVGSPLMSNVTRMAARQIRESDLYNGEDVVVPARPYRLSQVMRAMADRAGYRRKLEQRYARFQRVYPIFMRASVLLGIGVPLVLAVMLALDNGEKVMLLTAVLLWLVGLFVFLVVVESLRYSFERQLSMGHMTDERLSHFYESREHLVPAQESSTASYRSGDEAGDSSPSDGEAAVDWEDVHWEDVDWRSADWDGGEVAEGAGGADGDEVAEGVDVADGSQGAGGPESASAVQVAETAGDVDSIANAGDAEDAESADDAEHAGGSDDADDAGGADEDGSAGGAENAEGAGDPEGSEDAGDADDAGGADEDGNAGDAENTEGAGDAESVAGASDAEREKTPDAERDDSPNEEASADA